MKYAVAYLFIFLALIMLFLGIYKNDFLFYIRTGIFLIAAFVYYILVKKKIIGNNREK